MIGTGRRTSASKAHWESMSIESTSETARHDVGRLAKHERTPKKGKPRFSTLLGQLNYEKSFSTSFLRAVLLINLCPPPPPRTRVSFRVLAPLSARPTRVLPVRSSRKLRGPSFAKRIALVYDMGLSVFIVLFCFLCFTGFV